jgi:ABC-type sugar transport system ATPase subunit
MRCVKQKEPVLLVGDTGCGKVSELNVIEFLIENDMIANGISMIALYRRQL